MNGGGPLPGRDAFAPQTLPSASPTAPAPASSASASASAPPERQPAAGKPPKKKTSRRRTGASSPKRRCVSTACVACRKRKSKCDGAIPSCAACASVYGTECVYDPNSDHRRKGVYKDKVDSMKAQSSTLQILIEAMLNNTEDEAVAILKNIRNCESLDAVAQQILNSEMDDGSRAPDRSDDGDDADDADDDGRGQGLTVEGERELARKMGELRLENGSVRFFGGTSHLIYLGDPSDDLNDEPYLEELAPGRDPITTWTRVTDDTALISHLMDKYFYYHYPYFTTLSRKMFEQDYRKGRAGLAHRGTVYCSSLLVNAMLALGCHFTDIPEAYATPGDSRTKGDHFFNEAKRLIVENSEYERPRLVTVQALALMSVREAGCAREARGWVYSGMSFRMAQDIGLNLEVGGMEKEQMTEHEIDARRITFWGCFLFDKCWSNYLGRLPLLPPNSASVAKFDVFPDEDSDLWRPFPDGGFDDTLAQPSRIRAAALQLSRLCEISSDLLLFFYHPSHLGRSSGKAAELKKLSELHRRLEEWRKELPKEFEPREGQLPNVILMHMFFHLQYIHLFRPFLKYAPSASPLPSHVSPRRICTANAGAISKLMRLYKRLYNLRQICNIAVYMTHSACTIHLLNLPEKTARRDITHGLKHLEEIAEDWLCARRTLIILSVLARKWSCELPEEAALVLQRADEKYGYYSTSDVPSPKSQPTSSPAATSDRDGVGRGGSLGPQVPMQVPQGMSATSSASPVAMSSIGQTMHHHHNHHHHHHHPMGPGGVPPPALQQQRQPQMPPHGQPGADLTGDAFDFWNQQPGRPPMPSYTGPFAQAGGQANVLGTDHGPAGPPQANTHRMSPASAGLGGSEYFLSDSARWHQSFDMWGSNGGGDPAGDGSAAAAPFVFGQGGRSDSVNSGEGRVQQMWPESEEQMSGFENLDMSMNGGFYLPGLD